MVRGPGETPMTPNTHLRASPAWVGRAVELAPGRATAELACTAEMAVDERGLVHGSFVFGLADYAAMLAVNDPNVVLGAADVRFLKPVVANDTVRAAATVESEAGRKRMVRVSVTRGGEEVLAGTFTCFVLDRHVLEAR
jgi:acyl-coenzyme A thioesterase PaaI-like protein